MEKSYPLNLLLEFDETDFLGLKDAIKNGFSKLPKPVQTAGKALYRFGSDIFSLYGCKYDTCFFDYVSNVWRNEFVWICYKA